MDSLNKAGIPSVLVDRQWKGGYTSYVGPENFKIGQQDGQYIVDRLGGKGVVVVLKGGPADNSIGLNRTNGMLDIRGQSIRASPSSMRRTGAAGAKTAA